MKKMILTAIMAMALMGTTTVSAQSVQTDKAKKECCDKQKKECDKQKVGCEKKDGCEKQKKQ